MKKTLIIIAALAGTAAVSQAATLAGEWDNFTNLTNNGYTITNATAGNTLDITTTTGGPQITGTGLFGRSTTGDANRVEGAITVTISNYDLAGQTGVIPLFSVDLNGGQAKWGVGITAAGKIQGLWANSTWGTAFDPTTIAGFSWDSFTITATLNNAGTTIYLNGVLLGTTQSGLRTGNPMANPDKIYIGGASGGTWGTPNYTLDNFYFHQGVMSAAEVSDLYQHIQSLPEPTTATLGLLGLAGLMIRRRK